MPMPNRSAFIASLAVSAAVAGAAAWAVLSPSPVGARPAMALAPLPVAIIDLNRVLDGIDLAKQLQADLTKYGGDLEARAQAKFEAAKRAAEELQALVAGSPDHKAKAEEVLRLRAEADIELQVGQVLVETKNKEMFAQLFKAIHEAADRFAAREGYGLVLQDDRGDLATTAGRAGIDDMRAEIRARRVIYASTSSDITDALIGYMNAEFKAGGASAGAAKP